MSEVQDAIRKLEAAAGELAQLSNRLAKVERELEPLENWYEDYRDNFLAGMFEESDGKRLPGEDIRVALLHQDIRKNLPEKFGARRTLTRERGRIEKRIGTLKKEVEAQRSILSAEKELASV